MAVPVKADSIQPEAVQWLWRDRIPRGMITILGGRADQGKGLACAHIASEISRTRFVDDATGESRWGRVLYSAVEDSHSLMTRPRLEAAGANLNNIDLWRFRLPVMMRELEAHLLNEPIDLLVMDPLASHLSGGVSRHSDNIRTVTDPLAELVEATGTAVIIVEHVLKRVSENSHPLASIGGSGSGIVAASRMAFLFGTDPADEDRKILACVKHNIRDRPKELAFVVDTNDVEPVGDVPMLLFDDETEFDPMRFLVTKKNSTIGRPPDKKAQACEWLTNYLYNAGKPVAAGKVFEDAKHYGMNAKTLRRAASDMQIVRNPPGGGRNCTWELPDEVLAVLNAADEELGDFNVDTGGPRDAEGPVDGMTLSDSDLENLLKGKGDEE